MIGEVMKKVAEKDGRGSQFHFREEPGIGGGGEGKGTRRKIG